MSIKKSNKGLKPHKWLKKQIKIIFKWAKYLISIPKCSQRVKFGKKRSKNALKKLEESIINQNFVLNCPEQTWKCPKWEKIVKNL